MAIRQPGFARRDEKGLILPSHGDPVRQTALDQRVPPHAKPERTLKEQGWRFDLVIS
jgi:hypothetical protein